MSHRAFPILLFLSLADCGYTLVRSASLFGASRVVVEPFTEEVPLGISADVTQALAAGLAAGGLRLTQDREAADAFIRGVVVRSRTATSPTSGGLGSRVTAYRLNVSVRASLVSPAGKILWTGTTALFEDFLPGAGGEGQTLITEANRRRALRRLAVKAAEELRAQLLIQSAMR